MYSYTETKVMYGININKTLTVHCIKCPWKVHFCFVSQVLNWKFFLPMYSYHVVPAGGAGEQAGEPDPGQGRHLGVSPQHRHWPSPIQATTQQFFIQCHKPILLSSLVLSYKIKGHNGFEFFAWVHDLGQAVPGQKCYLMASMIDIFSLCKSLNYFSCGLLDCARQWKKNSWLFCTGSTHETITFRNTNQI